MHSLAAEMNPWASKTNRGKRIIPANMEAISQTGKTKRKTIKDSSIEFLLKNLPEGRFFLFAVNEEALFGSIV
jgi:hypothetical protein